MKSKSLDKICTNENRKLLMRWLKKYEVPVKVFHMTDEQMKSLGEICTNENSRSILTLLAEQELYVNQIANKLDMRVSLVIHHLKKLDELGFLTITSKPISKKTKNHNFYKSDVPEFTVILT